MFLTIVNEAFGYAHEQTLDSSFSLIISMLKEHNFLINERNKMYENEDEELGEGEEWVCLTDFKTGEKTKVKRVKTI